MRRALSLLFFLFVAHAVPGEGRDEEVLVGAASRFDPVPWAGNRFSTAVLTAPGWLGLVERPELLYGQLSSEGILDGDNLLCVRSRGFGFATESFHVLEDRETRRYVVALGRLFTRGWAVGLSYSWYSSDDGDLDDLTSWDIGIAGRPHPRIEVSATGRNLLRTELGPKELGRFYEAGVRGFLVPRRLTLFAQARHFRGDDYEEMIPVGGVEFFPTTYLALRGRADTDGNQGLGIEIIFDTASIGFHYRFEEGRENGSLAYVKLHVPRGP
ncbi:MAG: hypothetical protein ABIK65_05510 [Candidatus Eisenbacteria bacterium]